MNITLVNNVSGVNARLYQPVLGHIDSACVRPRAELVPLGQYFRIDRICHSGP